MSPFKMSPFRASWGSDFPEEIRENSRKTPQTLSEFFLEFLLESTAGIPQAL